MAGKDDPSATAAAPSTPVHPLHWIVRAHRLFLYPADFRHHNAAARWPAAARTDAVDGSSAVEGDTDGIDLSDPVTGLRP